MNGTAVFNLKNAENGREQVINMIIGVKRVFGIPSLFRV